jgi:chemotaxis protein MotB
MGDILFGSGKTSLKEEGRELLKTAFPELQKSTDNFEIFIAGHTDNVPIKGDLINVYRSNWELSTFRGVEVVKFLIDMGIKPAGLSAAGYGEYKPVAENTTDLGRSKNRRVEVFLIPKIIKRNEPKTALKTSP